MAKTNYKIFLHLRATNLWLQKTREQRNQYISQNIMPILWEYHELKFYWIDSEAFSARVTDIVEIQTQSLKQYYNFIEAIRDEDIFNYPFFEVMDIHIGIIDGYKNYEESFRSSEDHAQR